MGTRDARVDAYIAHSAEFARTILTHLRTLVHAANPDVTETIKWGHPHFESNGMLCNMAAFKAHCAFGFWHSELRAMTAPRGTAGDAMGQLGRIARKADLPSDAQMKSWIRKAAVRNATGVKSVRALRSGAKAPAVVPDDLSAALKRNREARLNFDAMSASHRREYIEWLTGAKRAETRAARLAIAIEWIAEGKSKEWKYRERRGA